jgi:predicted nucleic acid-binding protein
VSSGSPPSAFLDANVLVQAPVRDTILRCAERSLLRPLWSDQVIVEVKRTLSAKFRIPESRIDHLERQLREHFDEAWVEGYQSLIPKMSNDTKDRHVLAAAVHAKARYLVTYNLRDFSPNSMAPWDVSVVGPSKFLQQLFDSNPEMVMKVLEDQAAAINRTIRELLETLHKAVPAFAQTIINR